MQTKLLKRLRKEAYETYKMRCTGVSPKKYDAYEVTRVIARGYTEVLYQDLPFDDAKSILFSERRKFILRRVRYIKNERIAFIRNKELNVDKI